MKRQALVIALKYGVGLGLLAWVVASHWSQTVDGEEVGIVGILNRPIRPAFLLLGAFVCVTCVLLTFVRWFLLVRAQGVPFTLASALRLGLIGYYYNIFLPGAVGGDVIKAACIASEQRRRTVAVATVLVDRVVGLCGLIWLTALVGGICWAGGILHHLTLPTAATAFVKTIITGAVALTAGTILFWFALGLLSEGHARALAVRLERLPKIGHSVAELWRAGWLYRRRGGVVALTLLMSIGTHAGLVLTFYCAARGLFPQSEIPSFGVHYLIIPVGMMIKGFFPAPGGVGGGEYGFGSLYQLVDCAFAAGVLASLAQRAVEWSWGLVGYLVYLRMRPKLPVSEAEDLREPAVSV